MKDKMRKGLCMGMSLCLVVAGLTACGEQSSEDTSGTEVTGRITAKSDQEITVAVFNNTNGNGPKGASGGAVSGNRPDAASGGAVGEMQKPEGTPPADMQGNGSDNQAPPEGTPGADGNGSDKATPPSGMPGDDGNGKQGGPQSSESKTIKIDDDTVIYTQQGEEKTEATLDDLSLGSMVTVVMDGDTASSITVQNMMGGGMQNQQKGTKNSTQSNSQSNANNKNKNNMRQNIN